MTVIASIDQVGEALARRLRPHRVITVPLVAVSNAAIYSLIWLVLAIGLLIVDDTRRTRWTWLLIGVAVEWALTNGPIKLLARRQRPTSPGEAWPGMRPPRTSSFPSGHASASAFAVTCTAGVVGIWPPVLILGMLICVSRVVLRAHHATDILGGVIWGVALGLVMRLIICRSMV